MPKEILMIDDDVAVSRRYEQILTRTEKFHVTTCHIADEAYDLVSNREQKFDLIILDIMMPHLTRYNVDLTEYGLKTGVFVYRDIRNVSPLIPIIILTNVTHRGILDLFPTSDSKLQIRQKVNTTPLELEKLISETIG